MNDTSLLLEPRSELLLYGYRCVRNAGCTVQYIRFHCSQLLLLMLMMLWVWTMMNVTYAAVAVKNTGEMKRTARVWGDAVVYTGVAVVFSRIF